jgi:hypothetical protein|tara:strand:+ start:86 stop:316 length:231 start_codon:yes stop_codon:yes gene_type:complete
MGLMVSKIKHKKNRKGIFCVPKKKTFSKSKNIKFKKYKLNTKPPSVKFIPYDGEASNNNIIKYSYTYKGVPGGFYL